MPSKRHGGENSSILPPPTQLGVIKMQLKWRACRARLSFIDRIECQHVDVFEEQQKRLNDAKRER
jgi:hypothetical protein